MLSASFQLPQLSAFFFKKIWVLAKENPKKIFFWEKGKFALNKSGEGEDEFISRYEDPIPFLK